MSKALALLAARLVLAAVFGVAAAAKLADLAGSRNRSASAEWPWYVVRVVA